PQHRDRLRHRERVIEPRHRPTAPALGLLGLDLRDLLGTLTHPQPRVQSTDALVDPVGDRGVLRERPAEWVAGDWVTAHPDQQLQLCLRDLITHGELTIAEAVQRRPHPGTGWCSFL